MSGKKNREDDEHASVGGFYTKRPPNIRLQFLPEEKIPKSNLIIVRVEVVGQVCNTRSATRSIDLTSDHTAFVGICYPFAL